MKYVVWHLTNNDEVDSFDLVEYRDTDIVRIPQLGVWDEETETWYPPHRILRIEKQ